MTHSPKNHQTLLTNFPCFAMLKNDESAALAALLSEKNVAPGEIIAMENDLVEQIFIIESGEVLVTQQTILNNKIAAMPMAILFAGEAISLNDNGFFSIAGKRTVTVSALTDTKLLTLSLKDLAYFLQQYPDIQTDMHQAAETMLKMQLIKRALPFQKISLARLAWLISQVEKINLREGKVIFRQGDVAENAYLICSGQIEIFAVDAEGKEHVLAKLKSPAFFGEATLMTRETRHATARVLENCELLKLRHDCLTELAVAPKEVATMFMSLMVDHSRPNQVADVTVYHQTSMEGQEIAILKHPQQGKYFKLSEEGLFIWQHLNGKLTLQELTYLLADECHVFAPDMIAGLIVKLAKANFVKEVSIEEKALPNLSFKQRLIKFARAIFEKRIVMTHVDKKITILYNKIFSRLFNSLGQTLLIPLVLLGIFGFGFLTSDVVQLIKTTPHSVLLFFALIPMASLIYFAHEFGRALAVKAYGYEVHYMGIGWYWFLPFAFTDTSDMWLSTEGPRIVVNLAGVYTDIVMAGVFMVAIFLIHNPYVQIFLWLSVLLMYLRAFIALNPLQELEGYQVLTDLFDRPQLRQSAVAWVQNELEHAFRERTLFKEHLPETVYWIAAIFFLIMVGVIAFLLQGMFFHLLGVQKIHMAYRMTFPLLAILIACVPMIVEVRSREM